MNPKKLYRVKEAATRLNCSESTVRRLINERKLAACKIRRQNLRIIAESLEKYLEARIEKFQLEHGEADF